MTKTMCGWVAVAALAVAAPVGAQDAPATPPVDQSELRHHIYVMEGALARAVDFGAKRLSQQFRTVMPDVFLLAGEAQARGVYLEGYGVFFDVEVPMLRQSMTWSLRMMLDQENSTQATIDEIRRSMQGVTDPATRASLENAARVLEANAAAAPARVPAGAVVALPNGSSAEPAMPKLTDSQRDLLKDPNKAYTDAVQRALIDAMIDFSAPMAIGANSWLTVAARDNERRDSLAPQDPFEEVVTVLLRIKGSDLLDYRAGRIDKDEARRRVQVGQF